MTIGETIKNLREEKGYSQKELADVLNISASCLCKYETDKIQIPVGILLELAEAFNVSLDFLIGRTKNRFDINRLNETYVNKTRTYEIISDALSLSAPNRKTLLGVLKALKCQNEVEKLNN